MAQAPIPREVIVRSLLPSRLVCIVIRTKLSHEARPAGPGPCEKRGLESGRKQATMLDSGFRLISTSVLRVIGFGCFLLASCQRATPPPGNHANEKKPPSFSLSIPKDRTVDDLARYLAGVPGREGSAFKAAEEDKTWKLHAAQSELGWSRFLAQRQPLMRDFTKAHLSALPYTQPNLFYPFGGPDIMTAQTFYPAADYYVLVGLEPPGSLPDARMVLDTAASYLPKLRGSLGSILSKSFFITKEMDLQLRGQAADGLLPVMLIELVRNGNTVRGMLPISLSKDGVWVKRNPNQGAAGKTDGVAVEFSDAAGAVHTLAYFSLNLHNQIYKDNTAFHRFLDRLVPTSAMFKSTSYMPHKKDFDLIRSQVLERASAVVQDDSGIPFRFFDPAVWQVDLFGHYDQPYGNFRGFKQEDMRQAYGDPARVNELPFSIGYGFGRMKSNLIVAKKKS